MPHDRYWILCFPVRDPSEVRHADICVGELQKDPNVTIVQPIPDYKLPNYFDEPPYLILKVLFKPEKGVCII